MAEGVGKAKIKQRGAPRQASSADQGQERARGTGPEFYGWRAPSSRFSIPRRRIDSLPTWLSGFSPPNGMAFMSSVNIPRLGEASASGRRASIQHIFRHASSVYTSAWHGSQGRVQVLSLPIRSDVGFRSAGTKNGIS